MPERPPRRPQASLLDRIPLAAILLVGMAVAVCLAIFDPTEVAAPRCMLRAATGWDCPGCGSQRAIHALLHGDICQAWRYNAAMFFAVPLCVAYVAGWRPLRRLAGRPWFGLALAAAIVAWWVLRNV